MPILFPFVPPRNDNTRDVGANASKGSASPLSRYCSGAGVKLPPLLPAGPVRVLLP